MFLVKLTNIYGARSWQNLAFKSHHYRYLSSYFLNNGQNSFQNKTGFPINLNVVSSPGSLLYLNNLNANIRIKYLHSDTHHLLNKHATKADPTENQESQEQKSIKGVEGQEVQQQQNAQDEIDVFEEDKKLGLFARFKKMAKEYWYVLIPVHLFTSAFWFGGFFYMSKSGVDIVSLLEAYNFSEVLIKPLRDSHLGHVAIAYLLYKIATPARYTITIGGTTFAIKYLVRGGYIKPMPTRKELVQIYKDKRDDFKEKVADKKEELKEKVADKKQEFKDKAQEIKSKMSKF